MPLDDLGLLFAGQGTVQHGGGNSHLRQLGRLVLHQRNQRRDHDCGPSQHHRRQLVAQRFAAPGRHDHAAVLTVEQAAHDALLQGAKRSVSPVAPQRIQKIVSRRHFRTRHRSSIDGRTHQKTRSHNFDPESGPPWRLCGRWFVWSVVCVVGVRMVADDPPAKNRQNLTAQL